MVSFSLGHTIEPLKRAFQPLCLAEISPTMVGQNDDGAQFSWNRGILHTSCCSPCVVGFCHRILQQFQVQKVKSGAVPEEGVFISRVIDTRMARLFVILMGIGFYFTTASKVRAVYAPHNKKLSNKKFVGETRCVHRWFCCVPELPEVTSTSLSSCCSLGENIRLVSCTRAKFFRNHSFHLWGFLLTNGHKVQQKCSENCQ